MRRRICLMVLNLFVMGLILSSCNIGDVLPFLATTTPTPAYTPTPTDAYPPTPDVVINIEQINPDLTLGYDVDGELVAWKGANEEDWHTAEPGKLAYDPEIIKDFLNDDEPVGAIIQQVFQSEDITAETLADWKAGINRPPAISMPKMTQVTQPIPRLGEISSTVIHNVVLVGYRVDHVIFHPGAVEKQQDTYQIHFAFAYWDGTKAHTFSADARSEIYTGSETGELWEISPGLVSKKYLVGQTANLTIYFIPEGSSFTFEKTVLRSIENQDNPQDYLATVFCVANDGVNLSFAEVEKTFRSQTDFILDSGILLSAVRTETSP